MAENHSLFKLFVDLLFGENQEDIPTNEPTVDITVIKSTDEPSLPENAKTEYKDLGTVYGLVPGAAHLHGKFNNVKSRYVKRGLRVTDAAFSDGTGTVRTVWFNANVEPLLHNNVVYELRGKFEMNYQRLQITNPKFRPLSDGCGPFGAETRKKVQKVRPELIKRANRWDTTDFGQGLNQNSQWQKLRLMVLERDNYTCQMCGVKNRNLQVDHIEKLSLAGEHDINNLQTLCIYCHEDKDYRKMLGRKFNAIDNYGKNHQPTKKIRTLREAKKEGSGVAISYVDRKGEHTNRVIYPRKLEWGYPYGGRRVYMNQVYVYAYCDLDKADRTFRVSRMKLE